MVDLIDELLEIEPDVCVVYLGHNEFYGAGGVATEGGRIGRTVSVLRHLYLVRLIEPIVSRSEEREEPGTLMERLARTAKIPPADPRRREAFERFERNLGRILDTAAARGAEVLLCELASNERDLYPLGCVGALETSLGGTGMAVARWPLGRPSTESARKLLPVLTEELERDSLHAGLYYLRGKARIALDSSGAAVDLRRSRNLDAVPFRAPDAINETIRAMALEGRATRVPIDSIFRQATPTGIPGEESFVEHLHPTFLGNARIASAIADRLLDRSVSEVTEADAGRWLAASGLARLDLAFADARVSQLLSRWPYARTGEDAAPFAYSARSVRREAVQFLEANGDSSEADYFGTADPAEEEMIRALLSHRIDILGAHRQLARGAIERGEFGRAAHDLHAAASLFPVDASIWIELARVRLELGETDGAADAAQHALAWNPGSAEARELIRRAGRQEESPQER